jgi:hypothetical protein
MPTVVGTAASRPQEDGFQINHIPSKYSLKGFIIEYSGPAIRMEYADHRAVTSTGYSAAARKWQKTQAQLVASGKIEEAMQMDIDDIRQRFGTKYDAQIKEMLDSLPNNKAFQSYKAKFNGGSCPV